MSSDKNRENCGNWTNNFIFHELVNGNFTLLVNLDKEYGKLFSKIKLNKIYEADIYIRKRGADSMLTSDALLRKSPRVKNIDGSLSDELLLLEINDKKLSRQELFNSEIFLRTGSILDIDHPLLHVEITG